MVASDSLPEVFRASDEDRDDVIRMLRDGSAEGRLSQETFLARVDRALRAKIAAAVGSARPAPAMRELALPRGPRTVFTIGRSPDCDLPLGDPTVSWLHAELRRTGDDWVLVDLGSLNGTRVNGWRADSGFTVRAGDCVRFGRAVFLLVGRW